jgi:hypothetical protein
MTRKPRYEIWIGSKRRFGDRQVDCLIWLLREVGLHDERLMETLCFHQGFKRRLVARKRDDLRVQNDRPDLVAECAEAIDDGWWVWTNWNGDQTIANMRIICSLANLRFDQDVRIDYEQWGKEPPRGSLSDFDI